MGNTPRPGTWVLEKSLDGVNYEPWQYYAISDAECMRQFGIPATAGVPRFERDDEVHCTSEYSKITPLEGGEIHTSLINGRPGVEKPSVELQVYGSNNYALNSNRLFPKIYRCVDLQKFTRARFVRLRLISPRTLNADLMIINQQTHRIDKSVTMRYFYSISDISIGGQCICYGHAESCPSDPVTGQFKCECRHNTCGESCNRCCPLFNQLPWKPGLNSHPNACQQCQCFNHADSCVYDEELDNNKWSITPEGVYEGGGRCVDCKHNTEGFNCERCKDGFYRPSGLSHYREDACRACDCDLTGSISDVCIRDDQSALSGQHPGDCVCKPGFGGRRCERCAPGYRNYPRCEPCPCNQAGSVNFDTCEEENCQCKTNVEGLYCDRCREGTIHLNANNPLGCQTCFCFGLTDKCKEIPWSTAAITNNVGWNLTDLSGERDIRPEIENREVLMFNANQNKDNSLFYWKAPDTFTGNMVRTLTYQPYFLNMQMN
ncbi:laminin EGF-like protein [Dictyocaulus viviparus]|uniref:Laminin EGF-like protein n=1 Tax=Dictyocaulus viviparus TaxID=29172 RepID=A0A0D8Y1F2_DICVI|nr:laminin EGF-like protein [Dictyocaulus viviparus]